jgi:hypothetical protein
MNQRFGALPPSPGARVVLGLALAFTVLLGGARPAHATKAEEVSLDEETPTEKPKEAEGASKSSGDAPEGSDADADSLEPKVRRVIPPYSLPWQLRPVLPISMARIDTSFAFYGVDGASIVTFVGGSYKIIKRVSVFAKVGVAEDSPPTGAGGFNFLNPVLGGALGFWPAKSLKLGVSLGLTLPVGGGGSTAEKGSQETNRAGMLARSGFDNAHFMVDYFSVLPGVDLAWVTHNFTLQGELNIGFLAKVRGLQTEKSSNTDFSTGLHAGYFFFPFLSAGVDLRYQRWLSTPSYVVRDPTGYTKDNFTIGLGPRFHVKLSDTLTFRPGLSMSFGFDNPMSGSSYKIVQLDLPLVF